MDKQLRAEVSRITNDLTSSINNVLNFVKAKIQLIEDEITEIENLNILKTVDQYFDIAVHNFEDVASQHIPDILYSSGLHFAIQHEAELIRQKTSHIIHVDIHCVKAKNSETLFILLKDCLQFLPMEIEGSSQLSIRTEKHESNPEITILTDVNIMSTTILESTTWKNIISRASYLKYYIEKDYVKSVDLYILKFKNSP